MPLKIIQNYKIMILQIKNDYPLIALFFFILIIFSQNSTGQTTFNKRMSLGYLASRLTNILPTDTCYYGTAMVADSIAPFSKGALFLKFDLEGNVLFSKPYINTNKSFEIWQNTFQSYNSGSFISSGSSWELSTKTLLVTEFNNLGDTIWSKEYFHPLFPEFTRLHNIDFLSLPDSTFVFTTMILVGEDPGDIDFHVIKTDQNGIIEWQNTYGNQRWDFPFSMTFDSFTNEIIIGGLKTDQNTEVEDYEYQNYIFRLNLQGNITWEYISPVPEGLKGGARDMVVLEDGSLVIASGIGYEIDAASVNEVFYEKSIFKVNLDKEVVWEKEYKDILDIEINTIAIANRILKISDNSGFILVGKSGVDLPQSGNTFEGRGWISKISNEGDKIWTREYVGLDNLFNRQEFYDIKETNDEGFILCGESKNSEIGDPVPQQTWLLKLDEYGCLVPGCQIIDDIEEVGGFKFELKLFPNPTSDYLNIFIRNHSSFTSNIFSIYDNQGRLIDGYNCSIKEGTISISTENYISGEYFITVSTENQHLATRKFIVEK